MDSIYFIGIGGIGMSALARFYKNEGCLVAGYDRTPSKLTRELEAEGIAVHYEECVDAIPNIYRQERERTLVIYTPAVPSDMVEMVYFKDQGYTMIKRSAALGFLAKSKRCLAVAGTHGKTTTSTLLAHILTHSGIGCTAFLGGISKNYHSNLLLDKGYSSAGWNATNRDEGLLVAEADEFDRSFLQLFPEVAVITSTDADHLDIYGNHQTILEAFSEFALQVKSGGTLILKKGVELPNREKIVAKIQSYSYEESNADFYASNAELCSGGVFRFDIRYPGGEIEGCTLGIPGWVNVENAVAASAVALTIGVEPVKIKAALASFMGIERRFDIRVNTPQCAYIDDYAHHPSEIAASISSIRNIFPGRRLTGIFQPHLYSRTRDFADGFAESLSKLDELILLDIYPARELPIEGVSSKIIFDNVTIKDKILIPKERLMEVISSKERDTLITLGAGDIDRFVEPITEYLNKRFNV
jgi:UDP-N-acetylmuramate--alanine ligase